MSESLRSSLQSALSAFATTPLREASLGFFKTLGYTSQRTVIVPKSSPRAFLDLFAKPSSTAAGAATPFDQAKALFADWLAADLLFQLTDQELSREDSLFPETSVSSGQLRSYIFFAIELKDREYPRGKLAGLARQLNRLFPTPVMVLIKHRDLITLAVINRRRNKLDAAKDVLEKATLIRDIVPTAPHRGHLDILVSLALPALVHPQKKPITDFDTLHAAWEQIFNVELLNERFYRELSNWYFWALPQVEFPADLEADDEKRRATGLIRLLTRLIFCWFLKEKNLIPEKLFHPTDLAKLLKGFDPESETSSTYYQAILQNLFFATLNQRMGKDGNGKSYRLFATDEGFAKNRTTYDVNNLYRYESLFRDDPEAALAHFADIPFLNGGLFECLDRTEDGTDKKRYLDGFSRNAKKRPHVPDRLFFDSGETADLSTAYGDTKRKAEKVTGLITILNRYKFTIVENTPIDQEIALDPELLGKVFENLLASYNEETKTTARKQTGSFYTPRPIVDYMVDESLKAHLTRALVEKARMQEPDARAGLDLLFAYNEKRFEDLGLPEAAKHTLIAAIDALKILDPACGSGAFPMGVLHKLVYILQKLDPDNDRWKQTQLAKLDSAPMREELERAFADNNDDYGRKLYLIENCLYGVDIQPIAIQITKLRFFISLVCDQKTNRDKAKNHGIRPLPNLETKFVAANTLIGLPKMEDDLYRDGRIETFEKEIELLYHNHFSIQRRDQKLSVQRKIKALRQDLATVLAESLGYISSVKSKHLAEWDPFDPQSSADFFDAHWMFGRSLTEGFDIVIGNPPYGGDLSEAHKTFLKVRFDHVVERIRNSFLYFIGASFEIVKTNGIVCFILPSEFLFQIYMTKARRYYLDHARFMFAVNVGEDVFDAIVPTCLVSLQKQQSATYEIPIADFRDCSLEELPERLNTQSFQRVSKEDIRSAPNSMFSFDAKSSSLVNRLSSQFVHFEDFCDDVANGISTSCDSVYIVSSGKAESGEFEAPFCKPCIRGGQFNRFYCPKETGDRLLYITSDFDPKLGPQILEYLSGNKPLLIRKSVEKKTGSRDWHILFRARYEDLFRTPKIILRQTGDSIIAAVDEEAGYYCIDSVNVALVKRKFASKIWFLAGLLNSKLLNFFYREISQEAGRVLAQVKPQRIRVLPIAEANHTTNTKRR